VPRLALFVKGGINARRNRARRARGLVRRKGTGTPTKDGGKVGWGNGLILHGAWVNLENVLPGLLREREREREREKEREPTVAVTTVARESDSKDLREAEPREKERENEREGGRNGGLEEEGEVKPNGKASLGEKAASIRLG